MKAFDTELAKYAEKTKLKASERRELRERIFTYMEYHPLPKKSPTTAEITPEGLVSDPFTFLHFNVFYARIASSVFAFLLVVMPFIAEKALPGDVLYLVKTGINEPIQGQLVNSPYEKVEFETKLMERRISEARVLATEGKLTDEVQTKIAATVKGHTDAVQQGIAELREQDADSAAFATIAFNSSLEVQTAMLEATVNTATDTPPVASILTVVNDAHEENATKQQEENTPSYDSLLAQVEQETTHAYELFDVAKKSATEEEVGDIDRRLSDIDRLILETKERHETDPDRSVNDLTATLGLIQKLIAFMTDIDIQETVTLENLVPVILSDEERIAFVKGEIETLGTVLKEEVSARLERITEEGIKEKIEGGLVMIDDYTMKATVALEVSDIALAESVIREARTLMTDLDVITQFVEEENIEVPSEQIPADTEEGEIIPEDFTGESGTTTGTTTSGTTTTEIVPTDQGEVTE